MSFGFNNDKLKGKSPFSYVNVCTTFLNLTGRLNNMDIQGWRCDKCGEKVDIHNTLKVHKCPPKQEPEACKPCKRDQCPLHCPNLDERFESK